jgi:acyl-CoA thioesterase
MKDDHPPYGSGDRGRDYPALADEARQAILDVFNRDNPYFPGLLGLRVLDVRRGYARLEVENRRELSNPAGVMHGGASFGTADTAVAAALLTIYGPENALLTIEMKINYLEPILPGTVTAEAFVLRSSRRSAYAEVDIWAWGKLAARASTTYMIRPMENLPR